MATRSFAKVIVTMLATAIVALGLPGSVSAAGAARFTIADATLTEGNNGSANMSFVVSYTGPSSTLTVQYATSNGTATAGSDYTSRNGTLTVGTSRTATLTVPVLGDTTDENDETFNVILREV